VGFSVVWFVGVIALGLGTCIILVIAGLAGINWATW